MFRVHYQITICNGVLKKIALHDVGMEPSVIFQTLQNHGISRMFVYIVLSTDTTTFPLSNTIKDRGGRVLLELQKLLMLLRQEIVEIPLGSKYLIARNEDSR